MQVTYSVYWKEKNFIVENRQNHIRWIKIIQHRSTNGKWSFVVFSAACKFIFQSDDERQGCWRKMDWVSIQMQCDFGYVKTFLLWFEDGMSIHSFGNLVVIDENLNQHSHIHPLYGNLLEPVDQMFRDQQHPFMFQYDNVLCHRTIAVLTCFKKNDRRKMICPPHSPDINAIKNIRSWMKKTQEGQTNHIWRN